MIGDERYGNCVHGDGLFLSGEGAVGMLEGKIVAIGMTVFGLFQIHSEIIMRIIIKGGSITWLKIVHNFNLDCRIMASFRYMDTNGSFGFATSIKESYLLWYSLIAVPFLKFSRDARWSLLPITISASFFML